MPELDLPYGGVSDELAFDRQKAGTTSGAANVTGWDEEERRPAISRVPGQAPYTSALLTADTKVAMICDLVYDLPNVTYASLGNAVTIDDQTTIASTHVVTDSLGCRCRHCLGRSTSARR